jgi:recombination protein RecA
VKIGLVDKSGAWYAYKGDKIGQGKANSAKYLGEHLEIASEIETAIRDHYMPKPVPKAVADKSAVKPAVES